MSSYVKIKGSLFCRRYTSTEKQPKRYIDISSNHGNIFHREYPEKTQTILHPIKDSTLEYFR